MNPNTFTYNGVTVTYTEAQKAIILADQNLITQLQSNLRDQQGSYAYQETVIANAQSMTVKNGGCDQQPSSLKAQCHIDYNGIWDNARKIELVIIGYIDTINTQIASATRKLNGDIITIQSDIKLQIQAQLANTAAATAAANNQVLVTTAPSVVAANASATQTELANQAAADKLKADQNTKIAEFVIVAIVVIAIGFFIMKKAI